MNRDELRNNWEHTLVGEAHTYTLQAGAHLVRIDLNKDPNVELLVPVEELRGVLDEYEAMIGPLTLPEKP